MPEESGRSLGGLSLDQLCKICLLFLLGVQMTGADVALL